jgi:hypothetical protein
MKQLITAVVLATAAITAQAADFQKVYELPGMTAAQIEKAFGPAVIDAGSDGLSKFQAVMNTQRGAEWVNSINNTQQGEKRTTRTTNSNKLTVFFSAPLGFMVKDSFKPVEADLNFQGERELLFQSFREARMDIDLTFDTATTDRLIAARSRRCSCIHDSGHGYPTHLAFENGMGGVHWLSVDQLKSVISSGNGGEAPFNFVFVSACYSLNIGQTFVEAGTFMLFQTCWFCYKVLTMTICRSILYNMYRCSACCLLQPRRSVNGLCCFSIYATILSCFSLWSHSKGCF